MLRVQRGVRAWCGRCRGGEARAAALRSGAAAADASARECPARWQPGSRRRRGSLRGPSARRGGRIVPAGPLRYGERVHRAVRRNRPERVDLMELRHLRYFGAVAEEGSFVRAAGRLRVAQPALSKQIRDLEREVGVKLFERLPRGARVTRAGEQFLGNARSALESATRAVTTARRSDSATALRFAHSDLYLYTSVLFKLLAAFRQGSPETPLRVVRVNDVDQHAALREHRIDVAATFVATWPVPGLEALQLADCAITGVLLPPTHPPAAHRRLSLANP